jgi:hypothetical protein
MRPLKDQKSADSVRIQLRNLSKTIGRQTSTKITTDFPAAEMKPLLVNQQCVVYFDNVYICGSPFVMSRTDAQNGLDMVFNISCGLLMLRFIVIYVSLS